MNVWQTAALVSLLMGCRTPTQQVGATLSVRELSEQERAGMTGVSWKEGCPVPLSELVSVELPRGNLVVHRLVAEEVRSALAEALAAGFVIDRAAPIEVFGGSDDASMVANNSSGFNCRPITVSVAPGAPPPAPKFSVHSCGLAIDLNPLWNPYIKPKELSAFTERRATREGKTLRDYCLENTERCVVLPPSGVEHLRAMQAGTVTANSAVVTAFTRRGWTWGGSWPASPEDRVRTDAQHFEKPLPGLCSP